jgi:hypothetical protein
LQRRQAVMLVEKQYLLVTADEKDICNPNRLRLGKSSTKRKRIRKISERSINVERKAIQCVGDFRWLFWLGRGSLPAA